MKLFKQLMIIGLLSFLPATISYAQVPEATQSVPEQALININSADEKMLAKLPGIGMKKAKAIVQYRLENGDFKTVDELAKVKGVGEKLLAKLEGKIIL